MVEVSNRLEKVFCSLGMGIVLKALKDSIRSYNRFLYF